MDTLLLDRGTWDLTLDAAGNIALANGGYALAQDVASAVRTWRGEVWYNLDLGVPYRTQILGMAPNPAFMKVKFVVEGLRVPDVASITCYLSGVGADRRLTGQLQIYDMNHQLSIVAMNGEKPWYISAISP